MTVAAFFDMDRTLLRCNTGTRWLRFIHQRGDISTFTAIRAAGWLLQYKLAILDIDAVTERVVSDMRGGDANEMRRTIKKWVEDEILREVAPKARVAVAHHREEGHVLAILSTSTNYVTEPLAEHLGIEHVLCTRLGVADGRFNGDYQRPACYGGGKVHWAERFAEAHGVDLARSYFYTDSYADLPMLVRVGERRVINADPRLKRHARKQGWEMDTW